MRDRYDVLVAGGGTAGVIAVIQAGRAGARTLLVEKNGVLGGTMVLAHIPNPASFFGHGRQVIKGIGWELVRAAIEEDGKTLDIEELAEVRGGRDRALRYVHIEVNPAIFAALCDEKVQEAGADILFHTMPAAVRRDGSEWTVDLCTKTGLRQVRAHTLVDCTGDANIVSLAGLPVERNPDAQAATLVVKVAGYDASRLEYARVQKAFEKAVKEGRVKRSDPGWGGGDIGFFLRSYGGNRIHITDVGGSTSEERTFAEIEGRRAMMRLLRFCRTQPGLEKIRVVFCAVECGIRETVTIRGKARVTAAQYESGATQPDAVCYAFYPIDIHRDDHIVWRGLRSEVFPIVPLGALIPEGSINLIVAGRCVSSDREANSALRVQATCMAMGQAAGAAAALAARKKTDINEVPLTEIKKLLRRHGAVVPA